jgi:SNF family Na+-dependent transporter
MSQKESWGSRIGLVLAMAGNAVGLGNFLRFPAQAAKNGGGAFLIPYLVALIVLGLPLIWVEWSMGRFGGQHGHHSTPGIFQAHSRNGFWKYFGVMGLWSCIVVAAFYLYIESWTLAYAAYSIIGGFKGMTPDDVGGFFGRLTGESDFQLQAVSGWGMMIFAICIAMNVFILSRGLAKGIELVSKIGMPLLIIFAAILAVRGLMISPGSDPAAKQSALDGLNFIWEPRLTSLKDPKVWLAAAGQIFFTLSIGMGSIHCYASYLREKDDVALTGASAAWTNEFCEVILGGSILIPIAVAYLGLPEVVNRTSGGSGFGLGFFVFPTLFNNWGAFAPIAGLFWFGLLFFAAITSSLAMGQPVMAFLQQEYGQSRARSALTFGAMLLPLALPVALFHSATFFDEFDYWAGTVMLVVFALGESILFAWSFGMERGWAEMTKGAELAIPKAFHWIIKYVTPVFLILILIGSGGDLIDKLTHKDVAATKASKVADFDQQISDLKLSSEERDAKLKKLDADLESLAADSSKPGFEREAARLKQQTYRAKVAAAGELDDAKRDAEIDKLQKSRAEAEKFYDALPMWRNIDRLMMVGVYIFFSMLVKNAWAKRQAEGSV